MKVTNERRKKERKIMKEGQKEGKSENRERTKPFKKYIQIVMHLKIEK